MNHRALELLAFNNALSRQFPDWKGYENYREKDAREILETLTELDISGEELYKLPEMVSECKNLTTLNLMDSTITNWENVYETISQLPVTGIHVSITDFDEFPEKLLSYVSKLKVKAENTKYLTTKVPFKSLINLKSLSISGTEKINFLPDIIFDLEGLEGLEIHGAYLKEISPKIVKLSKLKKLFLTYNQIEKLPECFFELQNLEILGLSYNKLKSLPEGLKNLSKLETLEIEENPLESIPAEYFQLASLKNDTRLFLNFALKSIPPEIGQLTHLEYLGLNGNQLETLPKEIANLQLLWEIDISMNKFEHIPEVIFEIKDLGRIRADFNRINEIPKEIGTLTNMYDMYLSGNCLTDLPQEMKQLTGLTNLYLKKNKLTTLPEVLCHFPVLKTLDISENAIKELPVELANLTNLHELDTTNTLIKQIPAEIQDVIDKNNNVLREQMMIPDIDTTPYGKKLAEKVAKKLKSEKTLAYNHRDYCGKGFSYENDKYYYATVYDGDIYIEDGVAYDTEEEFVEWLAAQSDDTMSGKEEKTYWFINNQRITKERLEEFV